MRAIAIEEFGGVEKLQLVELPRPRPQAGEVLVRVVAAGVNPVDYKIREGLLKNLLPHAFPLIPGWDVAGVVESFGEGAGATVRRGDRVWAYARKSVVQWGCYAEYVAVPEASLSALPSKLLYEEAGGVPLAALTAFQALFGAPGIGEGSRVLIHAAAGGVGHFAVQLARNAEAQVHGTASGANHSFVLGLGAERVVDYTTEDFATALRREKSGGYDLVLDAVGGDVLERSYPLVNPGGRLVSIVEQPRAERAAECGISAAFHFVEPNGEQLGLLARLVDEKRLRAHVQKIYPLDGAAEAQQAIEQGHVRGKLVLNI